MYVKRGWRKEGGEGEREEWGEEQEPREGQLEKGKGREGRKEKGGWSLRKIGEEGKKG